MEHLLWRHEYYDEYYNCTFYDYRTIPIQKRQQTMVGISFIALFIFFETLYIPLLWIMRKKVFFHQACYKIMFYVGIVDVACLCCNGFSTGLFAIFGYVYCSSPFMIHALGSIALGKKKKKYKTRNMLQVGDRWVQKKLYYSWSTVRKNS